LTNISDYFSLVFILDCEFPDDENHFLWSHRHFLTHKPYALPKLLKSRSIWDYPSLIDIYGLLDLITHDRTIDEIESFELLLPAFPDMYIRSFAYRSLISNLTIHDLILYLPQLLQIIKFDYKYSSPIIEYLLKESINNHRLAHKLYWYLRQLLLTENIHFIRYYYLFMSLLYVIGENFRIELQNEYNLSINLRTIGLELKTLKINKGYFLIEQLKELNNHFFQSCRLPCQFNFRTNNIDINSCSIFNSLTLPIKIVFNSIDLSCEKYYSIFKIGDDLRQDQIILQFLSSMDKIWQANDFNFRLSLFNVVQTQERCGFIEMITESETLLEIEKPLGTIKGSFSESALYDWLRLHNTNERDFRIAVDNLTYSCAGYCVATYVLGIGDRHNENIMVKKSGHLFHIDFGKYLGDTQKFGWFNR
jgi:phosphatidylinositol-4-phosphate 3-kinase